MITSDSRIRNIDAERLAKSWRPGKTHRNEWRATIMTRSGVTITISAEDVDEGSAMYGRVKDLLDNVRERNNAKGNYESED